MNGRAASSSSPRRQWEQGQGDAMAEATKSSNSRYRAWKAMGFLPTCSRRQVEHVLHTYGEGNEWREAGDVRAGQAIFNDGEGSFWGHSGSGNSSKGSGDGGEPSSKQWFSVRYFGSVGRQVRARVLMAARCWTAKSSRGLLFRGE
jgi:hypothetical protein